MGKFAHDEVVPYEGSDLGKKEQVADMFNNIAHRYDFLNRFLSGGIDIWWRKKAIRELKNIHPQKVLDVATGTADIALLTWKMLQPAEIIGIDISEGMLAIGRKKIEEQGLNGKIRLETGDSENLRFEPGSFDAVTVAFGVRNFQNLEKGLKEMHRVLKPGGKLVILEFSKPSGFMLPFYRLYMRWVTPGVGKLFSRDQSAYRYLTDSVDAFPEGRFFLSIMQTAGFEQTHAKKLSAGISSIYTGIKK